MALAEDINAKENPKTDIEANKPVDTSVSNLNLLPMIPKINGFDKPDDVRISIKQDQEEFTPEEDKEHLKIGFPALV